MNYLGDRKTTGIQEPNIIGLELRLARGWKLWFLYGDYRKERDTLLVFHLISVYTL